MVRVRKRCLSHSSEYFTDPFLTHQTTSNEPTPVFIPLSRQRQLPPPLLPSKFSLPIHLKIACRFQRWPSCKPLINNYSTRILSLPCSFPFLVAWTSTSFKSTTAWSHSFISFVKSFGSFERWFKLYGIYWYRWIWDERHRYE